jgi:hypothetical protein
VQDRLDGVAPLRHRVAELRVWLLQVTLCNGFLGQGKRMSRESSPMWVWLTIGLLIAGSIGYAISVFFMEALMAAFH